MRKLLTLTVFTVWAAIGAAADKRDPIDAAIERTKQPKTETLAEAIRYEKMKDEAAARQARIEAAKASPEQAKQKRKPAEPVTSARK
jgi:hypothetical protein